MIKQIKQFGSKVWEKVKTFGRFIKKKVKQILIILGILGIATAATFGGEIELKWMSSVETLLFNTSSNWIEQGQYALSERGTFYYICDFEEECGLGISLREVSLDYDLTGYKEVKIIGHAFYDKFLDTDGSKIYEPSTAVKYWLLGNTKNPTFPNKIKRTNIFNVQEVGATTSIGATVTNAIDTTATSLTSASHSIDADTKALVVVVEGYDAADADAVISSVTYGGVTITSSGYYRNTANADDAFIGIQYKSLPAASGVVMVTMAGSCTDLSFSVINLVSTSSDTILYDTNASSTDADTTHGLTIPSVKTGAMGIAGIVNLDAAVTDVAPTNAAGGVLIGAEADYGSQTAECAYLLEAGSGDIPFSWTKVATNDSWALACSFYEQSYPTVALDSPANDATGVSVTPDLLFTGTDANSDEIEYNVQVNIRNVFGIPWNVTTAVYLQEISVGAKEASPDGLFFKSDGTKMYTIGWESDNVDEYDLSTAWNVTTAVYLQGFSVNAKETSPTGLFFKSDGLKMYTIGSNGDSVDEYDLSTAWNVTTAVYLQEISVSAKEINPQGLFFKSDGTKMYTIGFDGNTVDEYDLSTAWNVTTAVYLQEFSVNAKETVPQGLFFKSDGTKMYTIGSDGDTVDEYDLSTLLNKLSETPDAGFSGTGDPHPWPSGNQITYTVQDGDALDASTEYFWRVRGKDPLGSNTWGVWSPGGAAEGYNSFTTTAGEAEVAGTMTTDVLPFGW